MCSSDLIPQLYYGFEIMMPGDKGKGDGDLRSDFPGGWDCDERSCFVPSGRTAIENEAFESASKLLNWRKTNREDFPVNDIISKGTLTQYVPKDGVYVHSRSFCGKVITVIVNGTSQNKVLPLARYREVLPAKLSKEVIIGEMLDLNREEIELSSRSVLILEI